MGLFKKSGKKKAAAKSAAKTPAARSKAAAKRRPSRSAKQEKGVVIGSHPFAPGTEVLVHPAVLVGVERREARKPFGTPTATATVADSGQLEVVGLPKGQWSAAGPVGDRWDFVQFGVK